MFLFNWYRWFSRHSVVMLVLLMSSCFALLSPLKNSFGELLAMLFFSLIATIFILQYQKLFELKLLLKQERSLPIPVVIPAWFYKELFLAPVLLLVFPEWQWLHFLFFLILFIVGSYRLIKRYEHLNKIKASKLFFLGLSQLSMLFLLPAFFIIALVLLVLH